LHYFLNFQIVQVMNSVTKKQVRTYQCLDSTNIFFYSFLFPPFYYTTLFRNSVIQFLYILSRFAKSIQNDLLLSLQRGGLHFSRKQHAMVIHIGFQSCAHDYPHWFSFLFVLNTLSESRKNVQK
jgi:hypothetical protein